MVDDHDGDLRRLSRDHVDDEWYDQLRSSVDRNGRDRRGNRRFRRMGYGDYARGFTFNQEFDPNMEDDGFFRDDRIGDYNRDFTFNRAYDVHPFRPARDNFERGGGVPRTYDYGPSGGRNGAELPEDDERQPYGPYHGIGPQGYRRADERIFEDINDRLTRRGDLDATDVQVEVDGAVVTLRGRVENRRAKRTAEDVAASVPGVLDVMNELQAGSRGENG